jgi:hypothetical protein
MALPCTGTVFPESSSLVPSKSQFSRECSVLPGQLSRIYYDERTVTAWPNAVRVARVHDERFTKADRNRFAREFRPAKQNRPSEALSGWRRPAFACRNRCTRIWC